MWWLHIRSVGPVLPIYEWEFVWNSKVNGHCSVRVVDWGNLLPCIYSDLRCVLSVQRPESGARWWWWYIRMRIWRLLRWYEIKVAQWLVLRYSSEVVVTVTKWQRTGLTLNERRTGLATVPDEVTHKDLEDPLTSLGLQRACMPNSSGSAQNCF